jgi:F0F1-type ATP synthase assembly protein I
MNNERPDLPQGEEDGAQAKGEALASRIDQIRAEAAAKIEAADDDVETKLNQMAAQAAAGRKRAENREVGQKNEMFDRSTARGAGIGLTVAYAIIGVPVFGYGFGWLIDQARGTPDRFASILGLLGCFAGVGFAFFVLNKENQRNP